jgi:hypothetical protein
MAPRTHIAENGVLFARVRGPAPGPAIAASAGYVKHRQTVLDQGERWRESNSHHDERACSGKRHRPRRAHAAACPSSSAQPLRLDSDDSRASLLRLDPDIWIVNARHRSEGPRVEHWTRVCDAPCNALVDRNGLFMVAGDGLTPSEPFSLEKDVKNSQSDSRIVSASHPRARGGYAGRRHDFHRHRNGCDNSETNVSASWVASKPRLGPAVESPRRADVGICSGRGCYAHRRHGRRCRTVHRGRAIAESVSRTARTSCGYLDFGGEPDPLVRARAFRQDSAAMNASPATEPRTTPLCQAHRRLGAKMIDFGGWLMPVNYPAGILEEHKATRTAVGMFDVCHMGEVHFRGARAAEAVQRLVTNQVGRLYDGRAMYTVACNPKGGIVDDLIVYRVKPDHFLIVVNAANIAKDYGHFVQQVGSWCEIRNASDETGLISFQGPKAQACLAPLTRAPLATLKPFHFLPEVEVAGRPAWIARTGYTGEDGFEIFCAAPDAEPLWQASARRLRGRGRQAGWPRRARHAQAGGASFSLRQ